jgi:hypothetical protein
LVRCRPGRSHLHTNRDAHGYSDPDTDAVGHAYGHAHLAARSPNADCGTHGYTNRHADGDADGHADRNCNADRNPNADHRTWGGGVHRPCARLPRMGCLG